MKNERIELHGDRDHYWTLTLRIDREFTFHRADIPAVLIDGSGRRDKYPDGIIATREEQEAFAKRLAACWNACRGKTIEELLRGQDR